MSEKAKVKRKFCGNCGNHNMYKFPDLVFCFMRFCEEKDAVVQTLWCCEKWNPSSQECYCVEEAIKQQGKK
jgi:hypothetical protein